MRPPLTSRGSSPARCAQTPASRERTGELGTRRHVWLPSCRSCLAIRLDRRRCRAQLGKIERSLVAARCARSDGASQCALARGARRRTSHALYLSPPRTRPRRLGRQGAFLGAPRARGSQSKSGPGVRRKTCAAACAPYHSGSAEQAGNRVEEPARKQIQAHESFTRCSPTDYAKWRSSPSRQPRQPCSCESRTA
jgi:hypothetical protein